MTGRRNLLGLSLLRTFVVALRLHDEVLTELNALRSRSDEKISFKNENKSHSSNCEDLEPLLKQIDSFNLLENNNIRDEKNFLQI